MTIQLNLRHNIATTDIIYLKAKVNYTQVFLSNGTEFTVSKTLKTYEEELLTSNFFRIDRGHIINLDFVKNLTKNGRNIELKLLNDFRISVARRRKAEFNRFTRKAKIIFEINHEYLLKK